MPLRAGVSCDRCREREAEFEEACHGGDLKAMALEAGWSYDGGDWACPECYYPGDELAEWRAAVLEMPVFFGGPND